jgi:tetratricopeptide (TPR) repeat protein
MQKAVALFPNPHAYYFLSEQLHAQGRLAEAIEALRQAVERARDMPMADEWRKKLDALTGA